MEMESGYHLAKNAHYLGFLYVFGEILITKYHGGFYHQVH
jgi:hypothetical protein